MVPGQSMPFEKSRILAELLLLRRDARVHRLLLAGTVAASLLTVVTSFAYTSRTLQPGSETETIVEQLKQPSLVVAGITNSAYSREDRVRPGESVAGLMRRLGIYDPKSMRSSATILSERRCRPACAADKPSTRTLTSMENY